jgi:N-acetylated-alpha-linked acidic dipeptidase
MTRIWGLVTLRLANSDILPFDFAANGVALQHFLEQLQHDNKIDPGLAPLGQLQARIADFEQAGEQLRELTQSDLAAGNASPTQIQGLDDDLMRVESNWLDPAGIPGRPWFQHILYAARYTYAHLELPGLTEAVEAGNWQQAAEQADVLNAAVLRNTQLLQSAAASWRSGLSR